jgi:alcohol dehydrogenase class IV
VASIVDPELTLDLPTSVTRNSGYDALMHACESFLARPAAEVPERPIHYQGSNPFSRPLALEAFRTIWASYRIAVRNGRDLEARYGMSLGSHLAGVAFSHSGLGLVHALASALGGMIDVPHGVCLAACTHIGLRYNFEVCHKAYAFLARVMGEVDNRNEVVPTPEYFLRAMMQLIEDLGFPSRPSQLGITKADGQKLLENTLIQKRRIQTNPRPLDGDLLTFIQEGI